MFKKLKVLLFVFPLLEPLFEGTQSFDEVKEIIKGEISFYKENFKKITLTPDNVKMFFEVVKTTIELGGLDDLHDLLKDVKKLENNEQT